MREPNIVPSRSQGRQMQPSTMSRRRGIDPVRMLQSDIDRALGGFMRVFDMPMQNFFGSGSLLDTSLGDVTLPRIDVRDRNKEVEITADLPGVDEADIDISAGDGTLTITADLEAEQDAEDRDYVLRERTIGRIQRVVALPTDLDLDAARADFRNGLLTIRIPKTADASGSRKHIDVKSGETSSTQGSGSSSGQTGTSSGQAASAQATATSQGGRATSQRSSDTSSSIPGGTSSQNQ